MPIYVHVLDMPGLNAAARGVSPKVQRVDRMTFGLRVTTNAPLTPLEHQTLKTVLDTAEKLLVREAPELDR